MRHRSSHRIPGEDPREARSPIHEAGNHRFAIADGGIPGKADQPGTDGMPAQRAIDAHLKSGFAQTIGFHAGFKDPEPSPAKTRSLTDGRLPGCAKFLGPSSAPSPAAATREACDICGPVPTVRFFPEEVNALALNRRSGPPGVRMARGTAVIAAASAVVLGAIDTVQWISVPAALRRVILEETCLPAARPIASRVATARVTRHAAMILHRGFELLLLLVLADPRPAGVGTAFCHFVPIDRILHRVCHGPHQIPIRPDGIRFRVH